MRYISTGLIYQTSSFSRGSHFFPSETSIIALERCLSENHGKKILSVGNRSYRFNGRALYAMEKKGLKYLADCNNTRYYSLSEFVRCARSLFPKTPCVICGKKYRKGWEEPHCEHSNKEWSNYWKSCHPRQWEQEAQDRYCKSKKLPVRRQYHPGIDYYHPSVGWIEFVMGQALEPKDYLKYPSLTNGEPYKIVFCGKCPNTKNLEILKRYSLDYEVFE